MALKRVWNLIPANIRQGQQEVDGEIRTLLLIFKTFTCPVLLWSSTSDSNTGSITDATV